jgi:SAM-dependent methyltransferase
MLETVPYTIIDRCRACHAPSSLLIPALEMDPMPLAGQFCISRKEAYDAVSMPLSWIICERCGLVQVLEDVNDRALFKHYNYASSTVGGLVRHFEQFACILAESYENSEPAFLEIGCNDGVLLNKLPATWTKCGVDPSDVARTTHESASDAAYELVNKPFTSTLVDRKQWTGKWDVISGSNCLAHISDLRDVFEGVASALRPNGEFWIEVHDLDALLDGSQWDTIYHEHKAEWSLDALTNCLGTLGFERISFERIPMHGGALRCRFKKTGEKKYFQGTTDTYLPKLEKLSLAYHRRNEHPTVRTLRSAVKNGQRIAAFGAAGRANVYLNQMVDLTFTWIVDESPLRIGKFIPCVGTPIVDPSSLDQEAPKKCLITAWNYKDDIIRKNPNYPGDWLTAFPIHQES